MNKFLAQFRKNINSVYHCFDRVIVRGHIGWMYCAGSVINFLRERGFKKHTNGVMRILTDQLNSHVEKTAKKNDAPIIWWPNEGGGIDGDKLAHVRKKYASKYKGKKGNFVYCILSDKESTFTYATRELITKRGEPFDKMYPCRKPVKHYYIYFHDKVLGGPCYLKICTYIPYPVEFYFNGHNAIQLELERRGIKYRMKDNAFTYLENEKIVNQIAWSLSGNIVQERINYWMGRFFRFDKGKYSTLPGCLRHKWYCGQVEVSTNVIFKSALFCTKFFERILDKFSRIGLPDTLSMIFSKRWTRKDTKTNRRLYDNKACLKFWFISNSIKLYNKMGYLLRIETTINDPNSLGLEKPLINLREYLTFGVKCNERMQDCLSDVDVTTISQGEMELLDTTIEKENGQKIPGIDLRKTRQRALYKELLKPKNMIFGFRTRDLLKNLPEFFENLGQIRYELTKLRGRGLLEKQKGKSLWILTGKGFQMLWVKIASNSFFENPMISSICKNRSLRSVSQPSKLEEAYGYLSDGLALITRELAMKKAS